MGKLSLYLMNKKRGKTHAERYDDQCSKNDTSGAVSYTHLDVYKRQPEVHELLRDSGFPGMKVLEFGFDSEDFKDYQPHTFPRECVVYTGTHDNTTLRDWLDVYKRQSLLQGLCCQSRRSCCWLSMEEASRCFWR